MQKDSTALVCHSAGRVPLEARMERYAASRADFAFSARAVNAAESWVRDLYLFGDPGFDESLPAKPLPVATIVWPG